MKDIVCFEFNDWDPGEGYPDMPPFSSWMEMSCSPLKLPIFHDDDWVKENKLCIIETAVDMSISYLVTAPRKWVEDNCPYLLTEEGEDWIIKYPYPYLNDEAIERSISMKSDIFTEDEIESIKGKEYEPHDLVGAPSGLHFLDYTEKNIGLWWYDSIEDTVKRYDETEI